MDRYRSNLMGDEAAAAPAVEPWSPAVVKAVAKRWRGRQVRVHSTTTGATEGRCVGLVAMTRPLVVGVFGNRHIGVITGPQSTKLVAVNNVARIELAEQSGGSGG